MFTHPKLLEAEQHCEPMDSEPGHSLILWTARCSVALYCVALVLWWRRQSLPFAARCWMAAWAVCVLHVLCAFHFEHHWLHSAAIQHTAEMTQRVTGWYWGGGLYVNYVFLAVWGLHAVVWINRSAMPLLTDRLMHAVAVFMMFNATVVFGPRWWIIPCVVVCGILFLKRRPVRC